MGIATAFLAATVAGLLPNPQSGVDVRRGMATRAIDAGARGADLTAVAHLLANIPSDPAPPKTTNGKHYLTSNERRVDLFVPHIEGNGGVYVGVGSDQNYFIAGWARPSVMVIVDFDQQVIDLHSIHGAFLTHSATPQEYIALWSKPGAKKAETVLALHFRDPLRRAAMTQLFRQAREEVHDRLTIMAVKAVEFDAPSFLEDVEQYRHVARLFAEDRVIAIRGDFTVDGTVRQVAKTVATAGLKVRTLYLSNIEQYFMWRKNYRANMLAMPFDDETIVLRTLPGRPAGFEYIVQRGANFHAWLDAKKVYSVYGMRGLKRGEHLTASEKFVIDRAPPRRRL